MSGMRGFASRLPWQEVSIASDTPQQIAMLRILLATCETALDAFRAADNPLDEAFVADLERITERTREELFAFAAQDSEP
jgi:hypothetical protein